jgi:hypothetical protein
MKRPDTESRFWTLSRVAFGLAGILVWGLIAATATVAQKAKPAPTPGHPTQTPPEQVEPKSVPTSPVPEAPPGSLSDKLSKQKGVIPPPKDVDPGMHKAPSGEGKMRVIPPPGSSGSPSDVQPK